MAPFESPLGHPPISAAEVLDQPCLESPVNLLEETVLCSTELPRLCRTKEQKNHVAKSWWRRALWMCAR